jgi:hypothetical protein
MKWHLHILYSIELFGKEHKFSVGEYLKYGGMWPFHGIFYQSLGGNVRNELSWLQYSILEKSKAGDTLSSRHVSSCDVTSAVGILNIEFWRRLTLLSTLLTSRDLTWSSGRLTCQHASQISVVAHISWDVTYVSSALQRCYQLFPEMVEMLIEKLRQRTFLWHQVTRLYRSTYESQRMGRNREGFENKT